MLSSQWDVHCESLTDGERSRDAILGDSPDLQPPVNRTRWTTRRQSGDCVASQEEEEPVFDYQIAASHPWWRCYSLSSGAHSQAAPRTPLESPWAGETRRVTRVSEKA